MQKFVVVDLEANGLDVDTVSIHCVVMQIPGCVARTSQPDQTHEAVEALNELVSEGYTLVGHNIVEYDIPILRRYGLKVPETQLYDTLVVSRAAYPGNMLYNQDRKFLARRKELEGVLKAGAHSLKAWGLRLGEHKGDYTGGFEAFNEDMLTYCVQDVAVTAVLLRLLQQRIPDNAALLETHVAALCRAMRLNGIGFDIKAATELATKLTARREELTKILCEKFKPWYEAGKVKVPKRGMVSRMVKPGHPGYKNVAAGVPYQDIERTVFNPASTDHIANRLQAVYGWKPKDYTEGGKPQVTAEVLHDLPYPEAKLLAEYQEIKKILGYISEGEGAWLKLETKGRIHGKVNPTGTVSGRASHNRPNTGNVPTRSELGHACRSLFTAGPGRVLVGADASGLQLRCLAHYFAKWDGGEFARQCETGDIHEYMRQGTGLFTRNYQKTWTYAMLFGAGEGKLGQTAILDHRAALEKGLTTLPLPKLSQAKALGRQTLDNLGNAVPAFPALKRDLEKAADMGKLRTLDGRWIPIGSAHTAIAMLLQGAEAVIMKTAMVIAAPELRSMGATYALWVHDEFQIESRPAYADDVGRTMVNAIRLAGEKLELRVKLDGAFKVGTTWAETH
jgi:DNA polymerase I